MIRAIALSIAVLASVLVAVSSQSSASDESRQQREFVILNDDGYGTSDCLAKASACGKIVADAWCESKGFAKAVAYRPASADDVTQSVAASRTPLNETFVIACSE